jgi:hypothetical protein
VDSAPDASAITTSELRQDPADPDSNPTATVGRLATAPAGLADLAPAGLAAGSLDAAGQAASGLVAGVLGVNGMGALPWAQLGASPTWAPLPWARLAWKPPALVRVEREPPAWVALIWGPSMPRCRRISRPYWARASPPR